MNIITKTERDALRADTIRSSLDAAAHERWSQIYLVTWNSNGQVFWIARTDHEARRDAADLSLVAEPSIAGAGWRVHGPMDVASARRFHHQRVTDA